MSKRKIITIDEDACTGCGLCIPNCPEGALKVIDGKARLVSDLFCDGLGACLGHCPQGAITVEEREAEPYDERKVMAVIATKGAATIGEHLEHLEAHGQGALLAEAVSYLQENGLTVTGVGRAAPGAPKQAAASCHSQGGRRQPEPGMAAGCPGSRAMTLDASREGATASELTNWPVQLHLLSPMAPQFTGAHVVLSADCVAYACPGFHQSFLKGRKLAIACPKLDEGTDVYREKITALIDHAGIASLTVVMMEVPCCGGLLAMVQQARSKAHRDMPITAVVIGIEKGEVLEERAV